MFSYILCHYANNLSLLSYVPCAFYLFIAICVSSQVKILLLGRCFLNNFLKIIFKDPFHLKDAASTFQWGERGGSVVECRTPEREVGGSIPTAAVL